MDQKEHKSQYNREYYLRTRERQLEKAKNYYQENKASRRAYHKKYYAEHWEQENNRLKAACRSKSRIRDSIALHYGCRNPNCRWQGPFDPCQLDFHHFDQTEKKSTLGQMRSYSLERFIAEINKCVVLCRCCHPLFHKGGFPLDESLKCDVDPATCLPRIPNRIEGCAGIPVNPWHHRFSDERRPAGP